MREIKFRVWDSISKKIHQWVNINGIGLWDFIRLDHYTLMQYTGLNDVNGKEIYEGDVVKWDGDVMAVEWEQVTASFIMVDDMGYKFDSEDRIEVIGNIYETPELIK